MTSANSPIVVADSEKAIREFLNGEDITPKKESVIEMPVDIPLVWTIRRSIVEKIRQYAGVMDIYFENLRECELGLIPIIADKDPTQVLDSLIIGQSVTGAHVGYTPTQRLELEERLLRRSESLEDILSPGGVIHYHPRGYPGPSSDDRDDFEKQTKINAYFQNFYGFADATAEFATVASKEQIMSALASKDAVIISSEDQKKVYIKVTYGYSLFLIYTRDSEKPWVGLGQYKKFSYDGRESYELLTEKDGVRLEIFEDNKPVDTTVETMVQEISQYVSPLQVFIPQRTVVPMSVMSLPEIRSQPQIVEKIESSMPTTAEEFISLLKHAISFDPDFDKMGPLKNVCELFGGIYSQGNYAQQLEQATNVLRQLSPRYDAAMKVKK